MRVNDPGVYTVEAEPITLISERGRPITGYRVHKCGEDNGSSGKTEKDSHEEKTGGG